VKRADQPHPPDTEVLFGGAEPRPLQRTAKAAAERRLRSLGDRNTYCEQSTGDQIRTELSRFRRAVCHHGRGRSCRRNTQRAIPFFRHSCSVDPSFCCRLYAQQGRPDRESTTSYRGQVGPNRSVGPRTGADRPSGQLCSRYRRGASHFPQFSRCRIAEGPQDRAAKQRQAQRHSAHNRQRGIHQPCWKKARTCR